MIWVILRWVLVIVSGAAAIAVTAYALGARSEAMRQKIENLDFHEPVKAAIDNKMATARTFLQTGLIITGALWGLLIGGKDDVKILLGDWPEKAMFLLANVLIVASLWTGYQYTEEVTVACRDAVEKLPREDAKGKAEPKGKDDKDRYQISDVFGPRFDYLYVMQSGYLAIGALVSGFTLLSAHRLKEKTS